MTSGEDTFIISDQIIEVFTWLNYGVLCQIINIFGIVTNVINIICFIKQGFEDSVNISLLGLSVSDLGSLITMAWSCFCITPAIVTAELPFDPLDVMYITSGMVHFSFTRVSACITSMITLERCLCITAPLKIKSIMTPKRSAVIITGIFLIFLFSSAPVFVVSRLEVTFSVKRNKTLLSLVSTKDRENVEMISFVINNFLIPFIAFIIILVCTAILSYSLRKKARWRMKSITAAQVEHVSNRNQKAAKMVVMISTLFIVCYVPLSVEMVIVGFVPELSVNGKYFNISLIMGGIGYVMECINSSVNVFIYYHMSSKYKHTFVRYFCRKISVVPFQ